MPSVVCLAAYTLHYPHGGGHFWVYLNWALGLKASGCHVIWLEKAMPGKPADELSSDIAVLKKRLEDFGFPDSLRIFAAKGLDTKGIQETVFDLTLAFEADLLLNLRYDLPADLLKKFKRTAFLDIDPGLSQFFMANGKVTIVPHHLYFTIGETVGLPTALFPSLGLSWHYTPPCVDTTVWRPEPVSASAPFTTISHWNADEWIVEDDGSYYSNDKREGFLPFIELPRKAPHQLELAVCLDGDEAERQFLTGHGWHVRESWSVSDTPEAYKAYIETSRGEFSCVKPHYVKMQTAWISDRTLCYLASGKPAIVQHTGPSRFLPDSAGLFRFRNVAEALLSLEETENNYAHHCSLARGLAEEFFDAKKVTTNLLSKAI